MICARCCLAFSLISLEGFFALQCVSLYGPFQLISPWSSVIVSWATFYFVTHCCVGVIFIFDKLCMTNLLSKLYFLLVQPNHTILTVACLESSINSSWSPFPWLIITMHNCHPRNWNMALWCKPNGALRTRVDHSLHTLLWVTIHQSEHHPAQLPNTGHSASNPAYIQSASNVAYTHVQKKYWPCTIASIWIKKFLHWYDWSWNVSMDITTLRDMIYHQPVQSSKNTPMVNVNKSENDPVWTTAKHTVVQTDLFFLAELWSECIESCIHSCKKGILTLHNCLHLNQEISTLIWLVLKCFYGYNYS
jgi:hypothetical protein